MERFQALKYKDTLLKITLNAEAEQSRLQTWLSQLFNSLFRAKIVNIRIPSSCFHRGASYPHEWKCGASWFDLD